MPFALAWAGGPVRSDTIGFPHELWAASRTRAGSPNLDTAVT